MASGATLVDESCDAMSVFLTPNLSPRRARGASRVAGTTFTLKASCEDTTPIS